MLTSKELVKGEFSFSVDLFVLKILILIYLFETPNSVELHV